MKDIEQMRPNPSGTNIMGAINLFNRLFGKRDRAKKVVFVITQAKFSDNVNTLKAQAVKMERAGTKVYAIGLGDKVDKNQLEGIVSKKADFNMLEPIDHFPLALMTLQFGLLRRKLHYIFCCPGFVFENRVIIILILHYQRDTSKRLFFFDISSSYYSYVFLYKFFFPDIGPGSKLGAHLYKQSGIPGEKKPSELPM